MWISALPQTPSSHPRGNTAGLAWACSSRSAASMGTPAILTARCPPWRRTSRTPWTLIRKAARPARVSAWCSGPPISTLTPKGTISITGRSGWKPMPRAPLGGSAPSRATASGNAVARSAAHSLKPCWKDTWCAQCQRKKPTPHSRLGVFYRIGPSSAWRPLPRRAKNSRACGMASSRKGSRTAKPTWHSPPSWPSGAAGTPGRWTGCSGSPD